MTRLAVEPLRLPLRSPLHTAWGVLRERVLLSWLVLPIALRLIKTVREHADGPTLNHALAGTALMELLFCVLLAAGILAS